VDLADRAMQLRHVLVLTRDVSRSLGFWGPHGVGLEVLVNSADLAELGLPGAGHATLALKQTYSEAQLCQGYSPQLVLEVGPNQLDTLLHRLCGLGALLDG
jgi:hypothetical protein